MTFTVLPVLIAMVLAIAAMPTDVYKICRGEMGFEHARARRRPVRAWRARAVAFLIRLRALCARCRAHPLFVPAATLAAVLLVSLVVPAHLHGAPVMMGAINIKQLQQDDADNKAAQARVKADLGKLLDVPLKDRTAEQKADLTAKRAELTALEASAADLAADLALAQKLQETEQKQAASPATRVELGANHRTEGVSLGEVMQAMAYTAYRSVGRSDQAAMILPNGVAVHVSEAMQAAATGASSGVPESGGVLVRNEWSTALLERVQEQAHLAPQCFGLPIGDGNDGLEAPFVDETSRASGSRWGGVQVYRAAEAATVTAAQPKLGKFELRLEDLMALFYGTTRVIRDATLLEALAMKAFSSEFAFKLDDEIVRGTGAGQCLGIVGNAPTVSVAKETNQAAGDHRLRQHHQDVFDGSWPAVWAARSGTSTRRCLAAALQVVARR
jgi:HK97 family phage major capsid protein